MLPRFEIPAMRQRRSSSAFAPTDIAGLKVWLDASDTDTLYDATSGGSLVAADGEVFRIEDKSGLGNHAIQGTSTKHPLRKDAIKNGRSVLRFDGTNDALQITSIALNTFITLYVAASATTAKPMFIEHGANVNSNDGFSFYGTSNAVWVFRRGAGPHYAVGTATWMGSSFAVVSVTYNGAGTFYKNASAQSNGTISSTARSNISITAALNIFSRNQASAFTQGDLGEVLLYDGAHDSTQMANVHAYLNARWSAY